MRIKGLHDTAISRHQTNAVWAVDAYWHALTRGRVVPARGDIDPRAIQDALEYMFLAEQLRGGHARFRVAGGALAAAMGMALAGMPLLSLFRNDHRAEVARQVARVFDGPEKLTLTLNAPTRFDQPACDAEVRLYPLSDGTGRVTQLIGTFAAKGDIGRTPRRFDLVATQNTPLVGTPIPFWGNPITRGHLRLVVSNE